MSGAGEAVLGVILVGGSGLLLAGTVARARGAFRAAPPKMGRGGKMPGTGFRNGRRAPGLPRGFPAGGGFLEHRRQVALLWHKAWTADWLEEQREERKARRAAAEAQARAAAQATPQKPSGAAQPPFPPDPPEPPGAARAAAPGPADRPRRKIVPGILLWRKDRAPAHSGDSPSPAAPGGSRTHGASPPQAARAPAPATPEPSPASDRPPAPGAGQRPPSPQSGGTHMSTAAGGAVEQVINGVNTLAASAAAGNIHVKHGVIKACNEGAVRFSAMSSMMARALSEPGANYGPEITEPLANAAVHLQAAALAFGESDAALSSLKGMTVGDLASSPRQAPHNSELTESGAR